MDKIKNKSVIIRAVISIILVLLSFGTFNLMQKGSLLYAEKYAKNEIYISDLESTLSDLSQRGSVSVNTVAVTLKSAADRGNNVAYLQNNYQVLDVLENETTYVNNADALDSFFADDSKNARVEWYRAYSDTKSESEKLQYKWSFESVYSFSVDSIDVIWLCREDTTGELLAYTTGIYNVSSNQFSNIERKITRFGNQYIGVDETVNNSSATSSNTSSNTASSKTTSSNTVSSKAALSKSSDIDKSAVSEFINELQEYFDSTESGGSTAHGAELTTDLDELYSQILLEQNDK